MTSQRGMPSSASMRINKSASAAGAPSGFSFDDFGPELQDSICTENFRKKKTIPAVITGKDAFFCEKYSITASNPFMHQLRRNNPSISLLLQGDPHIIPLNFFFAESGENRPIRLSTDCLIASKRAYRPYNQLSRIMAARIVACGADNRVRPQADRRPNTRESIPPPL